MRSSTSSSKKYIGWGLIGFVILCVLSEVFIFRNVMFYGRSPGFIGQLAEMEVSFQHADSDRIKVAIWGDSQSLDALRPELMASDASEGGYAADEIFNFSISGGSAFDIYKTYLQYADRLPSLEKAIVIVNEHQFNNEDPANYILFKYYATLSDRIKVMNFDNYGELLLGWAMKSYDLRSIWTLMIEKYRQGELREEIPMHAGGLPPVTWSPKSDRTYEYATEVAERWFRNYKQEGIRTDSFEALVHDLTVQKIETIILQLPRSSEFEKAVAEQFASEHGEYMNLVQAVAARYGASFVPLSNEGMVMGDHFRDSNHVNPAGAELVSEAVADLLNPLKLENS